MEIYSNRRKSSVKIFNMLAVLTAAFVFTFLSSASPPAMAAEKPEVASVKILIIGSGSTANVAIAQIAARGMSIEVVRDISDGDRTTEIARESLPIINSRRIIETAEAAEHIRPEMPMKTSSRKSACNFTGQKFSDVPQGDYGYTGISFANPIRAQPRAA